MRIRQILATSSVAVLTLAGVACSSDDSDDDASDTTDEAADTSSPDDTGSSDDTRSDDTGSTTGATLPDTWPEALALPDGTTVIEATELTAGSVSVVAEIEDGGTEGVFDTLKAQLTDAGYEIVGSTFTDSEQGGFGSISARGDEYTVAIAFGPDPTGDTSQVTISVAPAA